MEDHKKKISSSSTRSLPTEVALLILSFIEDAPLTAAHFVAVWRLPVSDFLCWLKLHREATLINTIYYQARALHFLLLLSIARHDWSSSCSLLIAFYEDPRIAKTDLSKFYGSEYNSFDIYASARLKSRYDICNTVGASVAKIRNITDFEEGVTRLQAIWPQHRETLFFEATLRVCGLQGNLTHLESIYLKFFDRIDCIDEVDVNAAAGGHLDVVQWVYAHHFVYSPYKVAYAAAMKGHLQILLWMKENMTRDDDDWESGAAIGASEGGHFEILKWLHAQGYDVSAANMHKAAALGDLEMLKWLRERGVRKNELPTEAAKNGHLDVCKWLYELDRRWDHSFLEAAKAGHFEIVQWMIQNNYTWIEKTCLYAAVGGHLEILQWCIENGCKWKPDEIYKAAAFRGYSNILRWLHEEKHIESLNTGICARAAGGKRFETLRWLHSAGFPWDADTFKEAACIGDLDMLEWLLSEGCPWNATVCATAAREGHLKILRWLRSNGCSWDKETCKEAAREGHLGVLQWARKNGCQWGVSVLTSARCSLQKECFLWAYRNGCPHNEQNKQEAYKLGWLKNEDMSDCDGDEDCDDDY